MKGHRKAMHPPMRRAHDDPAVRVVTWVYLAVLLLPLLQTMWQAFS